MKSTKLQLQTLQLSPEGNEPLSAAWQLLIERRLEDVRFGRVRTLTHEEFWQRVQASRS